MKLKTASYSISFDLLDQEIAFEGTFRPVNTEEAHQALDFLIKVHDQVHGHLKLSFRRLRYINARGVQTLSQFIRYARHQDQVSLELVASAVLAWSEHVLPNLVSLWKRIEYHVHDRNFYGSQGLIEDMEFIPLLRNQTRILWGLEKPVLQRHGLERGMKVADICCGCGDVPLLVARELHPSFVLGVDHSEASMEYARRMQHDFEVRNVEFQRGDATALMLPDDSFDFVMCRLSLQIFSKPEQILKELVRITRPGGRIYTICEDYDLIDGDPGSEAIRETYHLATGYGAELGMDLTHGKKLFGMLNRARLVDIKVDHVIVDTANTDREGFAKVIESWRDFSVYSIGASLKLSPGDQQTLLAGYEAQLRAIASPQGYATWGLVACSGRKPALGAAEGEGS